MNRTKSSIWGGLEIHVQEAPLGSFVEFQRGSTITKASSTTGAIPVLAGGQKPAYYHDASNRKGPNVVVAGSGAYAGYVSFWEIPIWVSDAFTVTPKDESLLPKFLYHWLVANQSKIHSLKQGSGIPHVYGKDLGKLPFALPPIEVQTEIVGILDAFRGLEDGLEKEIEARKNQYGHFGQLFFGVEPWKEFESKELGAIASNLDSLRRPVTRGARTPGTVPYYGASGIVDYVSEFIFDGSYLLVSEDGANLLTRNTPIAFSVNGKCWVNNHAHVLHFEFDLDRIFVEHYLNYIQLDSYIQGGAQPKLNQANLNRIPVPVPEFEDKKTIVTALQGIHDLIENLNSELQSRRMQHGYYRDQLLTFKEA